MGSETTLTPTAPLRTLCSEQWRNAGGQIKYDVRRPPRGRRVDAPWRAGGAFAQERPQGPVEAQQAQEISMVSPDLTFGEGDLGVSVNVCTVHFLAGTRVTVVKTPTGFRADTAHVTGKTWDVYDWNLLEDCKPGYVQIGYEPSCPGRKTAGRIFGFHIEFTADLTDCGLRF